MLAARENELSPLANALPRLEEMTPNGSHRLAARAVVAHTGAAGHHCDRADRRDHAVDPS